MGSEVVPTTDELREFTHDELGELTGNYNEDNFLGETKYAKFYRGKIETRGEVTVKICKKFIDSARQTPSNEHSRLKHEIEFLQHPNIKGHQQNLATLIGYCPQAPGVVYDTNPRGTLESLILQDDFTWSQRLKVAVQLARMVAFFHNYSPPFICCNIDAAQIMVDQDYNMVLVDLGMLVGGFNCTGRNILEGGLGEAYDYKDLQFLYVGGWSKTRDVFSYGILLLSLISKRIFDISRPETSRALWAKQNTKEKMSWSELERNDFDVHDIFKEDPDYDVYDANKTMKLAMSCIELLPVDRPTMMEIIRVLQTLHVVLLNGIGEAVKSEVLEFLPCQLRKITGEFSEETFLGKTQFGKLYRGRILDGANRSDARAVTVKIWDDSMCGLAHPMEKWSKLTDEVYFWQHLSVNCHQQNLAKPIGYSRKFELLGVVYDINPRDTLQNLILKDDFTWLERIKVALQFAHLLVFFHDCKPPYIVRNIDAAHIVVDQDCNPVLFDVGMLAGGLLGTASNIPNGNLHGAPGYEDLHFLNVGGWSITRDVFSYGVLLMSLIAKRVFDISNPQIPVALWASAFCKECTSLMDLERIFSHVDKIFRKDPHYNDSDAYRIIKLAMSCIQFSPKDRPSMKQTYESLQGLHVVQRTGARKSVLREFLPEEWREFSDIFRQENFLGETQFAKLYRGMISCGEGQTRAVTVKIWEDSNCHSIDLLEKMSELMDEVYLLQHPSVNGRRRNFAKPIGYTLNCQSPGIVYDLNPRDTLHKLILRDNFNWLQRIRVAAQMAHLLHFLHYYDPQSIVRNISPAHILVDQEYNPVLLDFGMMVGGLFGKVRDIPKKELYFFRRDPGYVDPNFVLTGQWSAACDVYSFGVLLVSLFTKIVHDSGRPGSVLDSCGIKYQRQKKTQEDLDALFVRVHRTFKDDPGYDREDALDIVRLAIRCVEVSPKHRPTTYQICIGLQLLNAVEHFKKEFGIEGDLP